MLASVDRMAEKTQKEARILRYQSDNNDQDKIYKLGNMRMWKYIFIELLDWSITLFRVQGAYNESSDYNTIWSLKKHTINQD